MRTSRRSLAFLRVPRPYIMSCDTSDEDAPHRPNDAGAVHALVLVDAEELAGVVQLRVTCTSAALELLAAAAGPSSERGERREQGTG